MRKVIFALDPGTGYHDPLNGKPKNSATGLCVYDPNTDIILASVELRASISTPTWKRIIDLAQKVNLLMRDCVNQYGPLEVRTECFVMKGVSAEVLYRLVGAYIAVIPTFCDFKEVHNITLKKNLTGNAKATKEDIGAALLKRFPNQIDLIQRLIDNKAWDALDAIAIAVCTETKGD